jgi:2,5-dihydroxypyridine 5,6-dioxygenase
MERRFAELFQSIQQTVSVCQVRAEEKVVILADTATEAATTDAFYAAVLCSGADPLLVTMSTRPRMLMDPPSGAVQAMMDADVVFDLATEPWLYTESTSRILDSGTRMLQCFASQDTLIRRPPTEQILAREAAAREILEGCKSFRITSDEGTDLMIERGDRRVHTQGGTVDHPGDWDSYGVCLAAFAPPESRAEGKVFLNGTLHIIPHSLVLEEPIEVDVEAGRIVNVKVDHPDAVLLADWLKSWDAPCSYVIAHTGFGLDHRAEIHPPEAVGWESILGGVNIAFGGNNIPQLGGQTECSSHLDAILLNVNVELDGELIIDHGQFTEASGIE